MRFMLLAFLLALIAPAKSYASYVYMDITDGKVPEAVKPFLTKIIGKFHVTGYGATPNSEAVMEYDDQGRLKLSNKYFELTNDLYNKCLSAAGNLVHLSYFVGADGRPVENEAVDATFNIDTSETCTYRTKTILFHYNQALIGHQDIFLID